MSGLRTQEVSFEATMTDAWGLETFRAVETEREWVMHLAEGQKWPDECKRGRTVEFTISMDDYQRVFSGTVKFRRRNKLVLITNG